MLLAGLVVLPARAGSIIPPRDLGELARISGAVVLARAQGATALARGGMIYTHTAFTVLEVVSGPVEARRQIVVETYGGVVGDRGAVFGGSPHFVEDTVYLLFLERREALWQPRMLSYGLLERVEGADGSVMLNHVGEHHDLALLPRPDGIVPEPVGTYYEARLLDHLRQVVSGRIAWSAGRVQVPAALRPPAHTAAGKAEATVPAPCAYFTYEDYLVRWDAFDAQRSVAVYAEENGDADVADGSEFTAVEEGIAAWGTMPGVTVGYHWAGTAAYTPDCSDGGASPNDVDVDQGLVQYNDPCGQIADLASCSGILAVGGSFFSAGEDGRHLHREQEWNTSVVGYVIVNNGVGACLTANQYRIMMTHELGHTLGFDHIPFGAGLSIMNPACCVDMTDIDALCALYAYSSAPLPGTPEEVALLLPEDGALEQPNTLDFSWEADPAADDYHLQVSTDTLFADVVYDEDALTETTRRVGPLDEETLFFWRVRARNAVGAGPWSAVYHFTTQAPQIPPDSVVLVAPAAVAADQPTTLTLTWEEAERAARYHLQVSPDASFALRVYENDREGQTSREVGPLDHLTTYYWRVRAVNSAGEGPWSEVRLFMTLPPLPELVAPQGPANDAVNVSPTPELSWGAVAFADRYHLQVATTFTFSQIVFETDTLTTTRFQVGPLAVQQKYFWRVRAINAAGGGPWMVRQRFTTGTPPDGVALTEPTDGAVDQPSTIRFAWRVDPNAFGYHLQVSLDSSFSELVFEDEALGQTSREVGPLAYLTTHYWRVRGVGAAGTGSWSSTRRFTVAIGTAVEREGDVVPDHYAFHANYPNPFSVRTTLRFDLPEPAQVSLVVYDVLGRVVETLAGGPLAAGRFAFVWEAEPLPSGIYLVRLQAGRFSQTRRLLLVK